MVGQFSLIRFPRPLPTPTPRFRFPLFCKGSSSPCRKSTGEILRVICFTSVILRLAMGWPSSSGSSSKHRLRLVSAGNEATMRRRLYFPASVRRFGSARRRRLVSSTRFGWLAGENFLPSCKKTNVSNTNRSAVIQKFDGGCWMLLCRV